MSLNFQINIKKNLYIDEKPSKLNEKIRKKIEKMFAFSLKIRKRDILY